MARVRALIAAALLALPAGCAERPATEVAADRDASAAEIIKAGQPIGVLASDSRVLVIWEVAGVDEGPRQGAWRLYTSGGTAVAEGRGQRDDTGSSSVGAAVSPEGFVLMRRLSIRPERLDAKGEVTPSRRLTSTRPLANGVPLIDTATASDWSVYVPRLNAVVPLPKPPFPQPEPVLISDAGEVWVVKGDADGSIRLAHSTHGRAPWKHEKLPLGRDAVVDRNAVTLSGGNVHVPVGHAVGDRIALDHVLTRDAEVEGTWTRVDATGIPDDLPEMPRVQALPNGRLLATIPYIGAWLQGTDGRFAPLTLPRPGRETAVSVTVSGGGLWTIDAGARAIHSSADGKRWREFPL